jgi:chromosome segregation ATPase
MFRNCIFYSIIVVAILFPPVLFAQDDEEEIGYIDVDSAKKTIERLESENTLYSGKIKELESVNKQMNQEISQHKEKLSSVMDLIEDFKKNGLVLYEQSLTVIDPEGQKKASEAYEENKKTVSRLYAKKMELENYITDKQRKIKANEYEVISYKNRISINEKEVVVLQDSIDKTLSKIKEIDGQISSTNSLIEEADRLLE